MQSSSVDMSVCFEALTPLHDAWSDCQADLEGLLVNCHIPALDCFLLLVAILWLAQAATKPSTL